VVRHDSNTQSALQDDPHFDEHKNDSGKAKGDCFNQQDDDHSHDDDSTHRDDARKPAAASGASELAASKELDYERATPAPKRKADSASSGAARGLPLCDRKMAAVDLKKSIKKPKRMSETHDAVTPVNNTAEKAVLHKMSSSSAARARASASAHDDDDPDETLLGEEQSTAAMTEKEKEELRLKQRNAVYSKRKYERKKIEIEVLQAEHKRFHDENLAFKAENERLRDLHEKALECVRTFQAMVGSPPPLPPGAPPPPLQETADSSSRRATLSSLDALSQQRASHQSLMAQEQEWQRQQQLARLQPSLLVAFMQQLQGNAAGDRSSNSPHAASTTLSSLDVLSQQRLLQKHLREREQQRQQEVAVARLMATVGAAQSMSNATAAAPSAHSMMSQMPQPSVFASGTTTSSDSSWIRSILNDVGQETWRGAPTEQALHLQEQQQQRQQEQHLLAAFLTTAAASSARNRAGNDTVSRRPTESFLPPVPLFSAETRFMNHLGQGGILEAGRVAGQGGIMEAGRVGGLGSVERQPGGRESMSATSMPTIQTTRIASLGPSCYNPATTHIGTNRPHLAQAHVSMQSNSNPNLEDEDPLLR
jgi:hypothetical protein